MPNKATWLFNGSSVASGKSFGFSETWYTSRTGNDLLAAMDAVSVGRANLLAAGCAIVGYRIGVDNGRSFVVRRSFVAPGGNGNGNIPVDAALVQVGSAGSPNLKRFFLHNLPDSWINDGAVLPFFKIAIRDVVKEYCDQLFAVRNLVPTAPTAPILSIDAAGNVVTTANIALVANQLVQFLNCRDVNNRVVRGQYIVDTVTDATHFHIAHWTGQVVGRRGRVRLSQFQFGTGIYLGDDRTVIGAASRKVGRPFFQSRGRAPIRR